MNDNRRPEEHAAITDLTEVRFRRATRAFAQEMYEAFENGSDDERVRLVIEVPKSWLSLATWLTHRERSRKRGEWGPLSHVHNRYGTNHEKRWFKNQLYELLHYWFVRSVEELVWETHPYLEGPPKAKVSEVDDDIPF